MHWNSPYYQNKNVCIVQDVPLATEPGIYLIIFTTNEDIATKFEEDLPHCVRNVKEKNVLLFKFSCNIFIGVRIIKEMPGSVASGTPCITGLRSTLSYGWVTIGCIHPLTHDLSRHDPNVSFIVDRVAMGQIFLRMLSILPSAQSH